MAREKDPEDWYTPPPPYRVKKRSAEDERLKAEFIAKHGVTKCDARDSKPEGKAGNFNIKSWSEASAESAAKRRGRNRGNPTPKKRKRLPLAGEGAE